MRRMSLALQCPTQQTWQAMSRKGSSTAISDTGHGLRTRWAEPSLLMFMCSASASVMPKLRQTSVRTDDLQQAGWEARAAGQPA